MRFVFILFWFSMISLFGMEEWSSASRKSETEQIKLWEENFSKSQNLNFSDKLDLLGMGMKNMGHRLKMEGHHKDVDRIYRDMQSHILAIPGHAEYFGNKIEVIEEKLRQEAEILKQKGTYVGPAATQPFEQMTAFQILRELPSSETLRVLGEIILKEERVIKEPKEDHSNMDSFIMQKPPARTAIEVLNAMIEDPPSSLDQPIFPFHLEKWQQWYQQVKEGRRTIRFKGDPKDYSLQGPVTEARNPDVPRTAKRPDAITSPETSAHAADKPDSSWIGWLVGILGIFASAFYFLQRSKRAT